MVFIFQCFSNQTNVQFKAKFKFTLHGYFEYIRRDLLISHVHPSDELQLVLNMTVTFDTVTRTSQAPKTLGPPEPKPAEVTKDLESIFKDAKLSDFTIVVGDKEIPVHKVVLSARSPVFAAMLEPHTEEAKTNRVVLEDIDYETDTWAELSESMFASRHKNCAHIASNGSRV
ncbi:BTB/POZ domain protein [Cooperia oncophora]